MRILTMLREHGFSGEVVGKTPTLYGSRGGEIRAWLEGHHEVTSFVILDDRSDLEPLEVHHVHVDAQDGLLDAHVDAACVLLEDPR